MPSTGQGCAQAGSPDAGGRSAACAWPLEPRRGNAELICPCFPGCSPAAAMTIRSRSGIPIRATWSVRLRATLTRSGVSRSWRTGGCWLRKAATARSGCGTVGPGPPAGVIAEPGKGAWSPRLAFHPGRPLLATAGSDEGMDDDAVVHLWHLDPDRLLGQSRPPSVTYTSAKIVLVGESGVGKTGLGYRLAHGTEEASTSSEIQSVRRHQRPPRHCASRPAIMLDHARDASTQDQTRLSGIASTRHRHPGLPAPAAP